MLIQIYDTSLPVLKMAYLEGRLVGRLFQKLENVKLEFVMSFEEV